MYICSDINVITWFKNAHTCVHGLSCPVCVSNVEIVVGNACKRENSVKLTWVSYHSKLLCTYAVILLLKQLKVCFSFK